MGTNRRKQVVILVITCFILYLSLSFLALLKDFTWAPFQKVNILTELFKKPDSPQAKKPTAPPPVVEDKSQNFELYKSPELITDFSAHGKNPALPVLAEKLHQLKSGGKTKVRIAFFGDSMIEGDILTQTFRALLQKEFGGKGVGFLPISSPSAASRTTAVSHSAGFSTESFKTKNVSNLYISGYSFTAPGSANFEDNTFSDEMPVEKSIIYGNSGVNQINFNGVPKTLDGANAVNRTVLSDDATHSFKISTEAKFPIFGVSFESESGVFVDNFSFRGITGVELKKVGDEALKAIDANNHYDLVVLEYGVNMLFRPNDSNYDYYYKIFTPVLQKLKANFPNADFLLISTADRAFRYDGEYRTATGIQNLIETQARLAIENKMAFYNQFESMGGQNTIVKWAEMEPPLANKDYVHPNRKGAEILAQKLYRAMMNDYKKYQPKTAVK